MGKHTKGNWIAVGDWIEHEDDDVPDIATFNPEALGQDGRSSSERSANAMLCSAAPGMLAALEQYIAYYESGAITNSSSSEIDATEHIARLCYNFTDYLS